MRKKIIAADVSYEMVLNAYNEHKFEGIYNALGEDENGVIKVTKSRKVAQKIYDYLQKKAK